MRFLITSIFETLYFLKFLTTRHYINTGYNNSFEDIDFWPKICLILYPFLENSTTIITILQARRWQKSFDAWKAPRSTSFGINLE